MQLLRALGSFLSESRESKVFLCDYIKGRLCFDKVIESYTGARPGYPSEMYDHIAKRVFNGKSIACNKKILEVGPGSGQATSELAKWAEYLACVEPGENFVKSLNKTFEDLNNINIIHSTYEDFNSEKIFDLIFSGCALHWVPKYIVTTKSAELLTTGGWLIGAWNMPEFSSSVYDAIEEVISPVYKDFDIPRGTQEQMDFFKLGSQSLADSGLYDNCSISVYRDERNLNSDTLVDLIWSYMEVDEIREYGVSNLRLELEMAINSLQQNNHMVKNIYPVSYAQKI
jgi:protein-L-isoaspartate O-methyltransferase